MEWMTDGKHAFSAISNVLKTGGRFAFCSAVLKYSIQNI